MATFASVNVQTEVSRWYTVTGVPLWTTKKDTRLLPQTVKFVFRNGILADVSVAAQWVTKSGNTSERWQSIPDIYVWDEKNWPEWLQQAYALALADNDKKVGERASV